MKKEKIKKILIVLSILLVIELGAGYAVIRNNHKGSEPQETYVKKEPRPEKPSVQNDIEEPDLAAESACVYKVGKDGKGTFIYEKNAEEIRAQASTTKLMTAALLIESGRLEDTTVISDNVASTPESYHELEEGDVYNNHDLMYAMMLPSANDAAVAVAEGVAGDVDDFVDMMNERAEELGLNDTYYKNPHGLDQDGHYSTARDVAKLTAFAYTFPAIRDSWLLDTYPITSLGRGNIWNLRTTDQLVGYDENFKGGKTGTQPVAGFIFTGVYEYEGTEYVTVVMDCGSEEARWEDTEKLHGYIRDYAD